MIARLITWSARNLMLILIGTVFAVGGGLYALKHLPLDAIPDLSDTQVIVYTEYPGQAPQVVEDQVTYPLTTAMLTVPRSKVVRGFSFFGVSFVYVIFEDGTDIYWARSRVLEFLNGAATRLPAGITPTLGPDVTGVDWVYQYAAMSKELNLADTRSLQDWNLKFALARAEGVAEVASVGSFVVSIMWCSIRNGCAISAFPCKKFGMRSALATPMSAAARSSFPSLNMSSGGADT
jgi:Cu(I)/Ag(I) efflux system membrane protein CusA/SilA